MNAGEVPRHARSTGDGDDPRLAVLEHLRVPVWVLDVDEQCIVWANAEGLRFWGADDLSALHGRDLSDTSPSVRRNLERTRDDCVRTGRAVAEHWTLYPHNTPRSVETVLAPFPLGDGRTGLLAHIVDDTREQTSETLQSAQALLHTATMVTLHDESWNLLYANPAARAASSDGRVGLPEVLARADDLDTIEHDLAARGECDIEAPVRIGSGAWHAISVRESRDAISGARAILVNAVDITDRRAAEENVRRLAYRDTLTGLHNRAALTEHLDRRMSAARAGSQSGAAAPKRFDLLVIDLDRFKRINDSLGFSVGDELLVMTAHRLERLAGKKSFVGRMGNNEFVIVTDGDGAALADAILEAMLVPMHAGTHKVTVTPSIGVCHHPDHGRTPLALMRHADTAMGVAKRQRLGRSVFDEKMDRDIRERLNLENDLARALRADELEVHYQPRMACEGGHVVSFEALVRWRHPERGLLPPHEFVELAEETGMIAELGDQVMCKAMHQQSVWARAGYRIGVSINVSPKQFAAQKLSSSVRENIAQSQCDPGMIELEITESALFDDAESVLETLGGIRRLGMRIAIDDFGTGYSNLARLGTYPLDALKIDRAFVADTAQSTLLEAIVSMGHALGLELVAEGVETNEQACLMRERGCQEMQGFLYSRPLVAADATAYLAAHGRRQSDPLH